MERNFQTLELLGEGKYGKVYRAKDENGNENYAMKIVKNDDGIVRATIQEISLLKELYNINIVKLVDVKHSPQNIKIILEYVDTDLKKILIKNKLQNQKLTPKEIKSILYQTLKGVAFIHKKNIIHRDLKPGNILMTENNIVKIADFGLGRANWLNNNEYDNNLVTLFYRPIDLFLGNNKYSFSCDMWSVGCIFAEMVKGIPLFSSSIISIKSEKSDERTKLMEKQNLEMIKSIFHILGKPDENTYEGIEDLYMWEKYQDYIKELPKEGVGLENQVLGLEEEGMDLLKKLLEIDPEKRISAKDALNHSYFKDLDQWTKNLYKKE